VRIGHHMPPCCPSEAYSKGLPFCGNPYPHGREREVPNRRKSYQGREIAAKKNRYFATLSSFPDIKQKEKTAKMMLISKIYLTFAVTTSN